MLVLLTCSVASAQYGYFPPAGNHWPPNYSEYYRVSPDYYPVGYYRPNHHHYHQHHFYRPPVIFYYYHHKPVQVYYRVPNYRPPVFHR